MGLVAYMIEPSSVCVLSFVKKVLALSTNTKLYRTKVGWLFFCRQKKIEGEPYKSAGFFPLPFEGVLLPTRSAASLNLEN